MLLDVAPVLNIHLDSEHFNRVVTKMFMGDYLLKVSEIWHINSTVSIIFSRVTSGDYQSVIISINQALSPVVIQQPVLEFLLARLHLVKVFTVNCQLKVSHVEPPK